MSADHASVVRIRDPDDPRAADYRRLTDVALRRRTEPELGLFMAESLQVIGRALSAGFPLRSILTTPRWLPDLLGPNAAPEIRDSAAASTVLVAEPHVMNEITGYRVHRGALAAMGRLPLPSVADVVSSASRLVVLEGIVDHTNVGAVVRSAAGLGFDGMLVDPTCADPLYRRAVRVSMGATLSFPWTRLDPWQGGLAGLVADGVELVALTPDPAAEPLASLADRPPARAALVFGTEGSGLSAETLAAITRHVRIPMSGGVDSLNVAAAAAVACYVLAGSDRMAP